MVLDNKRRAELSKIQNAQKSKDSPNGQTESFSDYVKALKKDITHVRIFLKKSTKPGKNEYLQLLRAHTAGVLLLGFLGYVITFVHIPINNILFGVKR
ncbi:protein transport protein SEC61 subunit gamma [Nematocida sp. AWRm77]|nr:protein transport protein SEC61 subunit gamma [Nematocida sp. AWRm77]